MVNLKRLQNAFHAEHDLIASREKKEKAKIEIRREAEIGKVRQEFQRRIDEVEKAYGLKKAVIEENYSRRASAEIIEALDADYKTMQERSALLGLSEDDLIRLTKIAGVLRETANPDERKRQETLLSMALDSKIRDALPAALATNIAQRDINSYISARGSNGDSVIYLVLPSKEHQGQAVLVQNLEHKVFTILDQKEISCGHAANINPDARTVEGTRSKQMGFEFDFEAANDYIVYAIKPAGTAKPADIAAAIAEKLQDSNIQPEHFAKMNLTHRVMLIDSPILEYFKDHTRKEMCTCDDKLRSYEERGAKVINVGDAADILGYGIKEVRSLVSKHKLEGDRDAVKVSSLRVYTDSKKNPRASQADSETRAESPLLGRKKLNQDEVKEFKTEMYRQVDKYPGREIELIHDFAEILGVSSRGTIYQLAPEMTGIRGEGAGKRPKRYISKEGARAFISGWTPKFRK